MNLKVNRFFASLAVLALLFLPGLAHADGFLQKGDTAHPVQFYATDPSGNPLNGLTLTEQTVKNVTTSIAGTGTFSQPDPTGAPGLYAYTPSAADVDTYGTAVFNATATAGTGYATAVINGTTKNIVAYNSYDASLLGLTGVATLSNQALQATSAGQTANAAANAASFAALPAASASALLGASFLTIPGDHTTSGTAETLTFKQMQAILLAVPGSDNASTAPAASSMATTSYYLAGQPQTTANLVYIGTVTYNASGLPSGRTVKIAQPFPAIN